MDKQPELILARHGNGSKGLLVLRLWNAHRFIKETGDAVWVGNIGLVPRTYNWLFRSHPGEIKIDSNYIFPLNNKLKEWEWKIIQMNQKYLIIIIIIIIIAPSVSRSSEL